MSVFKENDIRGLYPEDWNKETAYKIGYFLSDIFNCNNIVIGRDGRESSEEILKYLTAGLADRRIDTTDIGIVDTPAVYFTIDNYSFDLGLMITASHNPVGYNGLKITGSQNNPIDVISGLKKLEGLLDENDVPVVPDKKVKLKFLDIGSSYVKYVNTFQTDNKNIKAVFDCSNGSSGRFIDSILGSFSGESIILNNEIDGSFPNHGPNPVLPENLKEIQEVVQKNKADIGFIFDGDGDRVVMIDGSGESISPDLITAILGLYYFKYNSENLNRKSTVLVDIRSSNSISEFLTGLGASVELCPAGHGKIKKIMHEKKAVFAGELSGHYYFKDSFYSDSAWVSIFRVLTILSKGNKTLLDLKNEILKYNFSGEISFKVDDSNFIINKLLDIYSDAEISNLDGYRFDYPDWWFIIRKSGTEPLIRLVVEAETKENLSIKVSQITEIITQVI
ncbi:MAG: phosphomannomutase/phosphoglucomutase [Spirochaetales bacterium]|nr:phosphomannomutase/phosphoglucomutase [Spirochaetales bacterium]